MVSGVVYFVWVCVLFEVMKKKMFLSLISGWQMESENRV